MSAVPTLKASPDFQRISKTGKRWTCASFILQYAPKEPDAPFNLGLTASRKVGNAVVRNRAKRRLREMVRLLLKERDLKGFDIVLIAKTAAASHDFKAMQADLLRGLHYMGVS